MLQWWRSRLLRAIRKGFLEAEVAKQRLAKKRGGESAPSRRHGKCKGPEVGESKLLLRNQMIFVKVKLRHGGTVCRTSARGPQGVGTLSAEERAAMLGAQRGVTLSSLELTKIPLLQRGLMGEVGNPGKSLEQERK